MSNNKKRRILIKLSGESLMGNENYGIELKTVEKVAKNIRSLIKQNVELCIVIGGGNIYAGCFHGWLLF